MRQATPPPVDDLAAAATYRCIVSNIGGSITSNGAMLSIDTLTDVDGNVYHQVKIGSQVWTMENLKTTKYSDGTPILQVTDSAAWAATPTTPKYCQYNFRTNVDSLKKWGALYNWYVVDTTNTKKIAPPGWHVPTDGEWTTIENYLIANKFNWDSPTTSNKIAQSLAAKSGWSTSTTVGAIGNDLALNNRSGFSALPAGQYNGAISNQSTLGIWWTTTWQYVPSAYFRYLSNNSDVLGSYNTGKSNGFSVRLVKNTN